MQFRDSAIVQKSSSPDLFSSRLQNMSQAQKPNQYIVNQRRQSLSTLNNHRFNQTTSPSFSIPILIDTMNTFYQSAETMEEEIMLPSRLKDMPVDELVFDNSIQPDTWHEIYTFVRDMRNQLQCARPFAEDEEKNNVKEQQRKCSNDDEGIIVSNYDNNAFSSASSTVSSEEFEQSSTTSVGSSYDTIKDDLKCHYYGLFRSLDNLTSLANRVTEKYREECN